MVECQEPNFDDVQFAEAVATAIEPTEEPEETEQSVVEITDDGEVGADREKPAIAASPSSRCGFLSHAEMRRKQRWSVAGVVQHLGLPMPDIFESGRHERNVDMGEKGAEAKARNSTNE